MQLNVVQCAYCIVFQTLTEAVLPDVQSHHLLPPSPLPPSGGQYACLWQTVQDLAQSQAAAGFQFLIFLASGCHFLSIYQNPAV